jgi:hypothetical protein
MTFLAAEMVVVQVEEAHVVAAPFHARVDALHGVLDA